MSLTRNLFEAQWDAYRMWRDFKRPVPSRPSQQHSLEGWEDTVRTQVTVACILTSGFFVFCTGQLEAWVDLLNGEVPADDGSASAGGFEMPAAGRRTIADSVVSWRACHPVSRNETIWWTYGAFQSEPVALPFPRAYIMHSADSAALCVSAGEDSQQQCSAESRLDTDNGTSITQSMDHLMAPNYNCWELAEERIPEDKVNVCEWSEQDFYSLGLGMGFHQISVRLLGWLLLNHIQVTLCQALPPRRRSPQTSCAGFAVCHCWPRVPIRQLEGAGDRREDLGAGEPAEEDYGRRAVRCPPNPLLNPHALECCCKGKSCGAYFSWAFQVWREEAQAQEETEARREHCRWRSEVDEPIVGYGHVRGSDRQLGLRMQR